MSYRSTTGIQRTIRVGDTDITYRGRVVEFDVTLGDADAHYVVTEYARTDVDDHERPVIFVFNGGPGSSSVWTHLGLGPRRVGAADVITAPMAPPFSLVDNDDTVLDVADLVFIDPPGTGYSRLGEGVEPSAFYGVEPDATATLDVIAQWVRRNHRERSPRYVAGESYGTLRAARMARIANGGPMLGGLTRATSLNGVIVLGPAFGMGEADWAGDVRAALTLPVMVASARYHGTASDTETDAATFARQELLPALTLGTALPAERCAELAERMSALIGIPAAQLEALGLRIDLDTFARTALADRGQHIGMYDSRYTMPAAGAGTDPVADDPGMGRYAPQFTGAIEAYLRDELGYGTDAEYRSIDFRITMRHWDYDGARTPSSGSFGELAEALRRDPGFRVLIAIGDYDLVTTTASTEFALSRHAHDASRVAVRTYASGHMPYLGAGPRKALAADIRALVTGR